MTIWDISWQSIGVLRIEDDKSLRRFGANSINIQFYDVNKVYSIIYLPVIGIVIHSNAVITIDERGNTVVKLSAYRGGFSPKPLTVTEKQELIARNQKILKLIPRGELLQDSLVFCPSVLELLSDAWNKALPEDVADYQSNV